MQVALRDERGKRGIRRLRTSGVTPAVLYGHGKPSVALGINTADLSAVIRQGTQLVELAGSADDTALVRDIQWDTFGQEILHVDLIRVSADEMIESAITVETRGQAPGVNQGGVMEVALHQVTIRCPATSLPEKLELNVNSLEIGQALTAGDLQLPDGAELVTGAEEVVVQCVEPKEELEPEETDITAEGLEPEVIARKEAAEGEETD